MKLTLGSISCFAIRRSDGSGGSSVNREKVEIPFRFTATKERQRVIKLFYSYAHLHHSVYFRNLLLPTATASLWCSSIKTAFGVFRDRYHGQG